MSQCAEVQLLDIVVYDNEPRPSEVTDDSIAAGPRQNFEQLPKATKSPHYICANFLEGEILMQGLSYISLLSSKFFHRRDSSLACWTVPSSVQDLGANFTLLLKKSAHILCRLV